MQKVILLQITPNAEELIEESARTCYLSEKKGKIGDLIKKLIKMGHLSVLEHASCTFRIKNCSRAMTHQLVRHRLFSFSQQSQRYVKEDQFEFVIPPSIENLGEKEISKYKEQMKQIQEMYNYWKEKNIRNEDARYVLPNACVSEIVISGNFRQFINFFTLRCDKHAQWEIRNVANQMLTILHKKCPNIFEHLFENC